MFPTASDSDVLLYAAVYEMARLLPQDRRYNMDMPTFTKLARHAGAYMNLCDPSIRNVQKDTFSLENFPPPGAGADVSSFVGGEMTKLGGIAKYCKAIV